MIENRISCYLYNSLFSESNNEKCAAFQNMVCFFNVHKNTILYFLFNKSKETSAILQPSVQLLVYIFPIFFQYHKCFNNFYLSKNILTNKFFH